MKRLPLIGCLVLCVAAATAEAVTVTYTTSHDVYIEWNRANGGISNRNSKSLLKQQWGADPSGPTDIVKSYIKFEVPADLVTINSVTLRLTNLNVGESDNDGDPVEIWALPDGYDGWDEAVLTWNQASSSYANDPSGRYFTAGEAVGTGTCNAGKGVATDFALDAAKMQALVNADTDNQVTLTLAAMTSSYWCDSENSTSSARPRLTWDYEVPEPATLSLLVLGGLACLRKRR